MGLLYFVGGVVIGIVLTMIFKRRYKTYGIIEVDHQSELCKVRLTSNELQDRKTTKVIFDVKHDATIISDEFEM